MKRVIISAWVIAMCMGAWWQASVTAFAAGSRDVRVFEILGIAISIAGAYALELLHADRVRRPGPRR